jgi:hypothetical protein
VRDSALDVNFWMQTAFRFCHHVAVRIQSAGTTENLRCSNYRKHK